MNKQRRRVRNLAALEEVRYSLTCLRVVQEFDEGDAVRSEECNRGTNNEQRTTNQPTNPQPSLPECKKPGNLFRTVAFLTEIKIT